MKLTWAGKTNLCEILQSKERNTAGHVHTVLTDFNIAGLAQSALAVCIKSVWGHTTQTGTK